MKIYERNLIKFRNAGFFSLVIFLKTGALKGGKSGSFVLSVVCLATRVISYRGLPIELVLIYYLIMDSNYFRLGGL